jgi:hypothetical protein
VDLSTNGPGGGPWHTPSQIYYFNFQAGPSFQHTMQRSGNSAILTWPSQLGYYAADTAQTGIVFTVQRTTSLSPATWTNIGTVTGTTANTATFTDPSPPTGNAFYRLRWNWSVANP